MVEGIGSVRLRRLMEIFRRPTEIFKAGPSELSASGILTPRMIKMIHETHLRSNVDREIKEAQDKSVKIVTVLDADYPLNLKEIFDPPIVLYIKGELLEADRNAVGVVGSRGASFYGLSCAKEFSFRLAKFGLTIVSGMARGIDTASHRSALDAGGRTIAILGSGLNCIYPPENAGLFEEIAEHGAVISQFPMNTTPLPANFPIRNRIISGLSRGVLVVEASYKSGALITARFALEQGREVFSIPGKLSSETSCGTNDLIKQGAKMVTSPEEILEDLRHQFLLPAKTRICFDQSQDEKMAPGTSNVQEGAIVRILSDEPKYIDLISQESGLSISESMAFLLQLELKGVVKQLPGKTFVKALN